MCRQLVYRRQKSQQVDRVAAATAAFGSQARVRPWQAQGTPLHLINTIPG